MQGAGAGWHGDRINSRAGEATLRCRLVVDELDENGNQHWQLHPNRYAPGDASGIVHELIGVGGGHLQFVVTVTPAAIRAAHCIPIGMQPEKQAALDASDFGSKGMGYSSVPSESVAN